MHKGLKVIIGLLIILIGLYLYVVWEGAFAALMTVIKGTIGLGIIGIGALFLLVGLTE